MSNCNGTCAQNWPPVKGPATAPGIKGTFGTIKRSDGSVQATFDGHPLYTFVGDTAPGQNKGNGLNAAGGLWHEVTTSGSASAGSSSSGSGGGQGRVRGGTRRQHQRRGQDGEGQCEGGDHLEQEEPADRRDAPVPGQVQVEMDRRGGGEQACPGDPE